MRRWPAVDAHEVDAPGYAVDCYRCGLHAITETPEYARSLILVHETITGHKIAIDMFGDSR